MRCALFVKSVCHVQPPLKEENQRTAKCYTIRIHKNSVCKVQQVSVADFSYCKARQLRATVH
jgi:hypothetical protein